MSGTPPKLASLSPLLLVCLAGTLGCASPGQPKPPSLHLPGLAAKLTVERNGSLITLAWTAPSTTTDGERIKGPITAAVCLTAAPLAPAPPRVGPAASRRAEKRAGTSLAGGAATTAAPPSCKVVKQLAATPGAGTAMVEMPPALTSGPPVLLAYAIQLQNAKGRSAGPSPPVFVAGGAAAPEVAALEISARREGALLRWQAQAGTAEVELKRTQLAPQLAVQIAAQPGTASAPAAPTSTRNPFAPAAASSTPREVVLRAAAAHDAGGMIDPTPADGATYSYVAQRVQTVTLAGHTLKLRSAPSTAVIFTYRDIFPPPPPTGLVLVPGGGFGEAPSIDLAWDASFENDLAGYNVYRRQGAGEFLKLNPEPLPAPAFRDLKVQPGQPYTYRVTAVDQRHNESAPGNEARETLR